MRITAGTHPGCRHSENQDNYKAGRLSDDTYWIVLCDGMGGASAGGKASEMAVEFLADNIEKHIPDLLSAKDIKKFMLDCAAKCNNLILEKSQSPKEPITMGTTLVMTIVRGNTAQFVHAGDSRAYVLHKNNFKQITRDHSIVQELLDCGKITPEQAYNHPNKNIITSALGVDANTRIDYNEVKLAEGDVIVICSDGLTNMINNADIVTFIKKADFFMSTERLIEAAVEAGGFDNITAVVLEA